MVQVQDDPVTAYAAAVKAGDAIASAMVRKACLRHLADLDQQAEKKLNWRPEQAQRAIDFFATVLFLPENTDAQDVVSETTSADPQPFVLAPWQAFIVGSLFGWYTAAGFRRFREAYIETSKGAGKTPLGAGIMLYLLVADGERGVQVFLAAVSREQAGYAWRDCRSMVQASPELYALFGEEGFLANELKVPDDGSFLKPVSSEKRGLDGKRVHGALIDELHEHATPIVVNKMRAGTKGRRNALIVKTTNSGFDRTSVCWNHHEYSRKVLDGVVVNDSWFAYICGLDPCPACAAKGLWFPAEDCAACDRWDVEGPHWLKANPNLGVSLPWQYVRERVGQAKGMPSEVSDVLRFNFCVWTQAQSRFIDVNLWQACLAHLSDADLRGAECYGGLDLGQTDDFTAFVLVWLLKTGRVAVKAWFWIPQGAIEKYPNRPYEQWKTRKILTVTEGNSTDYGVVRSEIAGICAKYGVADVAYDPKLAEETALHLTGKGITMIPTAGGFGLSESLHKLGSLVADTDLAHDGHDILGWMASNAVVRHGPNNLIRLDKEAAADKIDGISALSLSLDRLIRHTGEEAPETDLVMA